MSDKSRRIAQLYDRQASGRLSNEFYGNSGFLNYGYWKADTSTPREACENLMEELLKILPERTGKILDVGCGKGATTRYLAQFFGAENVTGINLSTEQLKLCRQNAPDCTFLEMNATQLKFPDRSFDHVIAVESAFHFDTREDFIKEAYRVLKPNGHLFVADLLMPQGPTRSQPAANFVAGIDDYKRIYERAGFSDVRAEDVTEFCVKGFAKHVERFAKEKKDKGEIRPGMFWLAMAIKRHKESTRTYVLLSATKA